MKMNLSLVQYSIFLKTTKKSKNVLFQKNNPYSCKQPQHKNNMILFPHFPTTFHTQQHNNQTGGGDMVFLFTNS